MVQRHYPSTPLVGVCTSIWRGGQMLLVQRGREPNKGQWAMPGGVVDVGEPLAVAAQREVLEETGLEIARPALVKPFEIIRKDAQGRAEHHYVLIMHAVYCQHGEAIAGDDAAALGWFSFDAMKELDLTGNTLTLAQEALDYLVKQAPVEEAQP